MVAKKKISVLVAMALATAILGGCAKAPSSTSGSTSGTTAESKKVISIGVTQIVEHPALDASRKGFIDGLKEAGYEEGKNIKIDLQNAQGDPAAAQSIASKFASDKKDMIFAIATPTAQAAYNVTKDIPILITAVTDPVAAGLAKTLEKSETNVTGTSDDVPIDKQFDLLKALVPTAKKIGIIYNTSEKNSELQVQSAKAAAPKYGFEIITAGVTNTNEITQSLNSILGKIDVLYVPTDNMIVSAIPLVTNECFKKNIPVIGSEKGQVEGGALATAGIDYYKLGKETAKAAVEVIKGKKPSEVAIKKLSDLNVVINKDAAAKLKINVPKEISDKAEMITGGVK